MFLSMCVIGCDAYTTHVRTINEHTQWEYLKWSLKYDDVILVFISYFQVKIIFKCHEWLNDKLEYVICVTAQVIAAKIFVQDFGWTALVERRATINAPTCTAHTHTHTHVNNRKMSITFAWQKNSIFVKTVLMRC